MKIYIWGTGRLVGNVVGRYVDMKAVEGFIDNDETKTEYMGKQVIRPAELTDYDAVLVANLYREEITRQCLELGIALEKVIFLYSNCIMEDVNKDYGFVEEVLGKEYADIVRNRYHAVRGVEAFDIPVDLKFVKGYWDSDYVRMGCFELAVKEIYKRKLQGAVAEVGVFRGEFAQYINKAFPDRTCYLFDTFDGFDAGEALKELKSGNCTQALIEAYKQTNTAAVIERMPYIDNIIIKQGYFPQSLDGLEDTFVFVSIDVDFEDSIYECLTYFYPRLACGGYIFVHDYNSALRGVEQAVDRYEKDTNIILSKMPLCDANGTLVITKGSASQAEEI